MRNPAGLSLIPVIIVAILALLAFWMIRRGNELCTTYQRLAKRFRGRCDVAAIWDRPSTTFIHKNAYAMLDIYSINGKRGKCYTRFRISWPDSRFRCEVYPADVLSRVGHFIGMRDIEIGSQRFDSDYVITGNDVSELREFLTPEVQDCIDQLRSLGQGLRYFPYEDVTSARDIYFEASGGQLLIKKIGVIREYEELEKFVLLALELYDHAMKTSAKGIEFVTAKPVANLSLKEAVCQICGETVKLDAVFCRSCKTPHHKDCWEYYGACSTYGCGQRRFLVQSKR